MATTTFPRSERLHRNRWIIGGIAVIIAGIIAALLISGVGRTQATPPASTPVTQGPIVASVAGNGAIAAERTLSLTFQSGGTVAEVLVAEGAAVTAGQPLARLDTRALQLKVDSAKANLQKAEAQLAQTQQGNTTPEEVAAQEASVANAAAQLEQTRTGNVTAADIAESEAQLRSAQAKLDDLLAGPKPAALSTAQRTLDEARTDVTRLEASLQDTRDSLSSAKTEAELAVRQATLDLQTAQSEYSTAYWSYQNVQNKGRAPSENEGQGSPELSDYGNLEAYETFKQAELKLKGAEETLAQKQLAVETAIAAERTGIAEAQAQLDASRASLRDAETQLAITQQGADTLDLTQAQASVDQYQAALQRKTEGGTAAEVAASQASLQQAQANLAKLTAATSPTDQQIQAASVAVATQDLKQAELDLDQATLRAPFAGVLTSVGVVPGSVVSSGGEVAAILDRSTLHVDMALSENDVAQVSVGQQVALTIDALPGWSAQGTVAQIDPAGSTTNGVVTYGVRVSFRSPDEQVRVGMTANLRVTTAEKQDSLLVPTSALLPKGAGQAVQVPNADGTTREVEVTTGLTDGLLTEVTSGLKAGDRVVTTPGTAKTSARRGLFGR